MSVNKDNSTIDGLPADETTARYIEYVRAKVDDKRWLHCAGTARLAAELAGRNGESSVRAAIAGLVHDVARPMSDDELVARIDAADDVSETERQFPVLLHGLVAVKLVREEMACTDEELLFAVRYHTCGHPELGTLGKCLMIADYAEPTRDFPAVRAVRKQMTINAEAGRDVPTVRITRTQQTAGIDEVLFLILENKIEYLRESGCEIEPLTIALRDTLRQRVEENGN